MQTIIGTLSIILCFVAILISPAVLTLFALVGLVRNLSKGKHE